MRTYRLFYLGYTVPHSIPSGPINIQSTLSIPKHSIQAGRINLESSLATARTCLVSATPDLLFHACLLALSHSGRHESTTNCTSKHVLCCSVQGRLKAVLLCLRYVDTMAFGAWFVLLGVQKKSRFKNESCVILFVFLGGHIGT